MGFCRADQAETIHDVVGYEFRVTAVDFAMLLIVISPAITHI